MHDGMVLLMLCMFIIIVSISKYNFYSINILLEEVLEDIKALLADVFSRKWFVVTMDTNDSNYSYQGCQELSLWELSVTPSMTTSLNTNI